MRNLKQTASCFCSTIALLQVEATLQQRGIVKVSGRTGHRGGDILRIRELPDLPHGERDLAHLQAIIGEAFREDGRRHGQRRPLAVARSRSQPEDGLGHGNQEIGPEA